MPLSLCLCLIEINVIFKALKLEVLFWFCLAPQSLSTANLMMVRYGCQNSNRKTANQLISTAGRERESSLLTTSMFANSVRLERTQRTANGSCKLNESHTLRCPAGYAIKSVCCSCLFLLPFCYFNC